MAFDWNSDATTMAQWKPQTPAKKWTGILRAHEAFHDKVEKPVWLKVLKGYRGKFFDDSKTDKTDEHETLTTSLNMLYAVADSANTSLSPPNPQFTVAKRGRSTPETAHCGQGALNYSADASHLRSVNKLVILDVLMHGRGIYKTVWDFQKDCAVAKYSDTYSTFFDLQARLPHEITYWIGTTLYTPEEFQEVVEAGLYQNVDMSKIQVSAFPEWAKRNIIEKNDSGGYGPYKSRNQWVVVREVYDIAKGVVYHFADSCFHKDELVLLLQEKLVDPCPYTLLTFTPNAEDCRGMAELQLILANQEELNQVRSNALATVQRSQAVTMADADGIDTEQIQTIVNAVGGSTVPVKRQGSNPTPLSELFWQKPHAQLHPELLSLMEMFKGDIATISALADVQRGQMTQTGASATQVALLESQLRTRLMSRQTELMAALEDVGSKLLHLNAKYMSKPKWASLADGSEVLVDPRSMRDITATYKLMPYSPIAQNRAVVQDVFKALLPMMLGSATLNPKRIWEVAFAVLDIPELNDATLFATVPPPGPEAAPGGAVPPAVDVEPQEGSTAMPPPTAALPGPQAKFSEQATNGAGGVAEP